MGDEIGTRLAQHAHFIGVGALAAVCRYLRCMEYALATETRNGRPVVSPKVLRWSRRSLCMQRALFIRECSPRSSLGRKSIMSWPLRGRNGNFFLVFATVVCILITIVNYNVLKELPSDSAYWTKSIVQGK